MAGTESSGSPFHPPSFSSRKVVLVNQRFQLADRNRRLVEAKTHLFDRQYRQCIAKCAEHLNYWGDAAPPLVKTYLHYLTAASHDALARDMHILSTSRLPTIELAERHYNAALEALIPPISLPSSPHTSPSKSSKQSRMDSVVDTMLPHRSPSVSPTKRAGSSTAFQTPRSQRGCTRIHEVGSAEEEDSDSNVDIVLPSRGLTVSPTKLSSPTKTTKTSITKLSSPTKSSKIPQTPKKSTDTSPSKPKKWSRTSPIKPTRTDEENKADSGSDSLYNFIPRSEATGRLIQLLDVADKAIKGVGHGDDLRHKHKQRL
ncbi:hypothetical protein K490DRAFT_56288 [Saccharata proteae CBS 121410]|uniref:Uncharacterized protein n=1 Tax=Saccharata proteae CBS 121410 TaxID=1314787 RepID=A0A9P4HWU3_9PEZI|nr:hypothetical protein K490DRAFT_56288 [Saccharata proteae CBS 121410]